jgi:hypothetical protein
MCSAILCWRGAAAIYSTDRLTDAEPERLTLLVTKPTTEFDSTTVPYNLQFFQLIFDLIWGSLFYHATPCSPVRVKQRFGVTHRVALQGGYLLRLYYSVLGLHFEPEEEDDMSLRNVSWLLAEYTAFHSRYLIYIPFNIIISSSICTPLQICLPLVSPH